MKKSALSVMFVATLPLVTIADEGPDWTYLEASYLSSEIDLGVSNFDDLEPDGWEIGGSVGLGEWFFINGAYSQESDNVKINGYKIDLDLDRYYVGLGAAWSVTNTTDLYGRAAYEGWKSEPSALGQEADNDEDGYSVSVGVRSKLWKILELKGEIGTIDVDEFVENEARAEVGAYYTMRYFTVGASYIWIDDLETFKATLRYEF